MTLRASLPLVLLLSVACVEAPTRSAEAQPGQAKSEQPAAKTPAVEPSKPQPGSTELTAEELELLDADPKTLSPDQNRKRAYALRKKIMQNPDSPQAQALEEARAAALGGELTEEQVNPDAAKKDPGMVIELPEHLKDPRVSKDDPAK